MNITTLTIIAIILPILTGIGGVFLGFYIAVDIDAKIQKLKKVCTRAE